MHASLGQYVTSILGVVKIVVISRLLGPFDIGVATIALSIVLFVQCVRVFGVGEYLISRKEERHEDLRTCFTLLYILAISFSVAFWLFADLIAAFFDAPKLSYLLQVLTIYMLISPLTLITIARFNRTMRFREQAILQVFGSVTEVSIAVCLAVYGFGPASLIWGYIASAFSALAITCWFDSSTIILRPSLKGWRQIARFGVPLTFSTLLTQLGVLGPALIVGRQLDAAATGYFSRGQVPVTFFRQALEQSTARVALAWFAQISRADPDQLRQSYIKATALSSGIAWPFYVVLFFNAPTIIPLLLGEQWLSSVPIAQALAIGGMFSTYTIYGLNMLAAVGRADLQFQFNCAAQTIRFAVLLCTAPYGLETFAWAFAASNVVSPALLSVWLRKSINLRYRILCRSMIRSFLVAVAVAALNYAALQFLFTTDRLPLLEFVGLMAATGLVWLLSIVVTRHEIFGEVARLVRNRRARQKCA